MVIQFNDFLQLFNLRKVSYEEFCKELSVLNISDKSGSFAVKWSIDDHFEKVIKDSDPRRGKEDLYKTNLYNILVVNAEKTLKVWFDSYVNLRMPVDNYFDIPNKSSYKKEENFLWEWLIRNLEDI